ncbi:MAG: hypothetical protein COA31_009135 [Flavobacteriales bacterium]|nr:hypothetical protein [Flavobacteriales bacterium]
MKQEKVNKAEIITLYEQSNFVSVINNFEPIKLNELALVDEIYKEILCLSYFNLKIYSKSFFLVENILDKGIQTKYFDEKKYGKILVISFSALIKESKLHKLGLFNLNHIFFPSHIKILRIIKKNSYWNIENKIGKEIDFIKKDLAKHYETFIPLFMGLVSTVFYILVKVRLFDNKLFFNSVLIASLLITGLTFLLTKLYLRR